MGSVRASSKEDTTRNSSFKDVAASLKDTFKINGEPINPRIIDALLTWISDHGDQVVAIDLLGSQNSNQFFIRKENIATEPFEKFFKVTYKYPNPECNPSCTFSYKVYGKTNNGVYVITTVFNGQGSGVFNTLLLVKIKEEEGYRLLELTQTNEKQKEFIPTAQKRLIIEKMGEVALGDRSIVKQIEIKNNIATISIIGQKQDQKTILLNLNTL